MTHHMVMSDIDGVTWYEWLFLTNMLDCGNNLVFAIQLSSVHQF